MGDTESVAAEVQRAIQRNLTGAQRLQIAVEMSLLARDLAAAGLRSEHPEWSAERVTLELLRYAFQGHELPPPLR